MRTFASPGVGSIGQILFFAPLIALAVPSSLCRATTIDETPANEQRITELEQRASLARPQDQCFLYADLVHKGTELAGAEMLAGDTSDASLTLQRVLRYADLIHMNLSQDTKRLKNSEILLHHTTLRLDGYLQSASADDRPVLQSTLKRLDQVQSELLMQVFQH